jgi:hypothetical protein
MSGFAGLFRGIVGKPTEAVAAAARCEPPSKRYGRST